MQNKQALLTVSEESIELSFKVLNVLNTNSHIPHINPFIAHNVTCTSQRQPLHSMTHFESVLIVSVAT